MSIAVRQSQAFSGTQINPSITFGSNNLAHSVLVVTFFMNSSSAPAVSDTQNNTWVAVNATPIISNSGNTYSWAYICLDCKAGANQVIIVTGAPTSSISGLYEITGITGPVVENYQTKLSGSSTDTTPSITPSVATSISIAHAQPAATPSACTIGTGGFSPAVSSPGPANSYCLGGYKIQTSAAATACQFANMAAASNGLMIFDIVPTTYSIAGSAGVAAATVSYSGTASGSVTADGSGNYSIPGLLPGSYTITPSLTDYSFSPTSSNQTITSSNITGVNFTATFLQVATPTFTPDAGTYAIMQTVTIATSTASASLFYTVDGSTPTAASTPYTAPISFAYGLTLKAIGTRSGYANSAVKTAAYVFTSYPGLSLTPTVTDSFSPNANPLNPAHWTTFTGAGSNALKALSGLAVASLDASGSFGDDYTGVSFSADQYAQANITISLASTSNDGFIVVRDDGSGQHSYYLAIVPNADGVTCDFSTGNATTGLTDAANFIFPQGDPFTLVVVGTNFYALENGVLCFGPVSDATIASGKVGIGAVTTSVHTDVEFGSFVAGSASLVQVATPTMSPGGGSYTSAQTVTLACSTSGASIYYTTDGSTPTSGSTLYTVPFSVSLGTTLKAIGIKAGDVNSNIASATYNKAGSGFGSGPFNFRF